MFLFFFCDFGNYILYFMCNYELTISIKFFLSFVMLWKFSMLSIPKFLENPPFKWHSQGFIFGLFRGFAEEWHMDPIQCVPTAFFLAKLCVGGQQLSLRLCCIYSPNRIRWLYCQSCFNDLHRRLLPVTCSCCIVRCQSQWVARHRAQQTCGQRGEDVGRQTLKLRWKKTPLKHGCRASKMRIPKTCTVSR